MGRQIHFYMTPEDEQIFLDFVRTTGGVHLYPSCSPAVAPEELQSFAELMSANPSFRPKCYLWNEDVSPAPEVHLVRAQKLYCIDAMQSEVVDFRPCIVSEDRIRSGRLYVDPTRLENGHVVWKSKPFLDWYSCSPTGSGESTPTTGHIKRTSGLAQPSW